MLAVGLVMVNSISLFAQQPDSNKSGKRYETSLLEKDTLNLKNIEDQYIIAELEKIQYANYNKSLRQAALQKELENQRLKTVSLEQKLVAQQLKTEASRRQMQAIRSQEIQQSQIKHLKIIGLNQQVSFQEDTRNFLIALVGLLVLIMGLFFWYNRRLLRKNKEIKEASLGGQKTERRRIAADLHDNLGGMMSAIRLSIEAMDTATLSKKEKEVYDNVLTMTRQAYNDVRLLAHNLQPEELEKFGLTEALQRLIHKLNDSQSIHFSLINNGLGRLSKEVEFNLYSICLELSNNIIKHSGATEASFEFVDGGEQFQLLVTDNGRGFIQNNTSDGMGMKNIQERTEQMAGRLKIHSRPDEGTLFQFSIPLLTPPARV